MDRRELTKIDKETLDLELRKSILGRKRNIKKGYLIVVGGTALGVTSYLLGLERVSSAITILSLLMVFFGLFNLTSWFLFSNSIDKLKIDIENGIKNVGQFEILRYNPATRKVTLNNGFKIDRFEIPDDWKKGDWIYIERLPTSNFILKCDRNAR